MGVLCAVVRFALRTFHMDFQWVGVGCQSAPFQPRHDLPGPRYLGLHGPVANLSLPHMPAAGWDHSRPPCVQPSAGPPRPPRAWDSPPHGPVWLGIATSLGRCELLGERTPAPGIAVLP